MYKPWGLTKCISYYVQYHYMPNYLRNVKGSKYEDIKIVRANNLIKRW
jgi:hypothetical protein